MVKDCKLYHHLRTYKGTVNGINNQPDQAAV